jgi:RNA polymerase sigma factor (sigma-70 family)
MTARIERAAGPAEAVDVAELYSTHAGRLACAGLRGDEDELFRLHHRSLVRTVARSVNASDELIEDACQSAWETLLRCQPARSAALFGWLRTVALHKAYRLSGQEHREVRLEDLAGDGEWDARVGSSQSLENAIEARRALETLAALPAFQRDDLALLVAGFSYDEIAKRGERPRSVNNVNKRLTKARARIRRLEAATT